MANWTTLKAAINNVIKTNNNQAITGQVLQNVLNNVVSSIGENYQFVDIAIPTTNPGAPDGNVFYIAYTAGTYANFNGIVVNNNEVVFLLYKGGWSKKIIGLATAEELDALNASLTKAKTNIFYAICGTAANAVAKVVTIANFELSINTRFVIKMTNSNTAANTTLNVNNTGAKPIYYNGALASADNSWEDGETLDVYYDGENYQASNFQGGGVNAEKVKFENEGTGIESENVQGALEEITQMIIDLKPELLKYVDKSKEVSPSDKNIHININNGALEYNNDIACRVSANYINIEGASYVRFFNGFTIKTYSAGYAFYNSEKEFISGGNYDGVNTTLIVNIPEDAKYFRYTFMGDSVVLSLSYNRDEPNDGNEDTDGVDLINRVILSSGKQITYSNGKYENNSITSATQGYINIDGFESIKTILPHGLITGGAVYGIAFYKDDFTYISGILGNKDAQTEPYNEETIISVPKNAVYFRGTIIGTDANISDYVLIGYITSSEATENYNDFRLDRIDVTSDELSVAGNNLGLALDGSANCKILCRFKNKTILEENGTIEYQGNTSLQMPKKGFAFTFSEKHRFKNWIEMDEYHCKGYYSDWIHCRDLLANKILEQVILTRPQNARRSYQFNNNKFEENDFEFLVDSGALCHVDGFPVELYINNGYWGLYSLNIKKERDNYKLKKDDVDHIQIEASEDTAYTPSFDWTKVEIRCPKSDSGNTEFADNVTPKDGEVKAAWIGFLTNLNAIDEVGTSKENLEGFLNLQDWIDNILVCWFLNHTDNWSKNTLYTSWDAGVHWSPLLYDMDNTFGIVDITGASAKPYNYNTFAHKAYGNCPWLSKIETILSEDIKNRYAKLRKKGIFAAENVDNLITSWVKEVGTDVYKDDTERWSYPGLGNTVAAFIDSQYRMVKWISDRLGYLDEKYDYTE